MMMFWSYVDQFTMADPDSLSLTSVDNFRSKFCGCCPCFGAGKPYSNLSDSNEELTKSYQDFPDVTDQKGVWDAKIYGSTLNSERASFRSNRSTLTAYSSKTLTAEDNVDAKKESQKNEGMF